MAPIDTAPACWQVTPHSIADRDFWSAARQSPRFATLWNQVFTDADAVPPRPTIPTASDYLAAKRFHDRSRLDRVMRTGRATLSTLLLRRAALGVDPTDPDDRLLDWIWSFATQPTWVLSAHLPGKDLPMPAAPQLDLAACEMAATLAEAVEVVRPWMDSVSETMADAIIEEIDRRVLRPYGDGVSVHWQRDENDPDRHYNNWVGVCAGNILAACESLAAQGRPRPEARRRAIAGLDLFFKHSFTDGGECDEGMGYWSYGVGMAVVGLSRLSPQEVARHLDLDRIAQVADYPRRVHLFDDIFFSGNDAPMRSGAGLAYVPWLAALTGNAWLAKWAASDAGDERVGFCPTLRILALPDGETQDAPADLPPPAPVRFLPDQQTALLNAKTSNRSLTATLSGGTNGERHNHNDLGHFIIAVNDELIIPDLGNLHYRADFFGPNRYSYRAAASWGHNCPIIAGHDQRTGGDAAGTVLAWDEASGELSLDLTAAYPPEAGLSQWTRSIERDGEAFIITDEYRTSKPNQPVTHVIWSLQPPSGDPRDKLTLGPLNVSVSPSPTKFEVELHSPADLLLREFNDHTLHRLEWHYTTDAQGTLRVQTRFE